MKIALSTAFMAALVAPAFSLSYLESLNKASTVTRTGNAFANGASYLDAISAPVSTAPTGAGMTSYLDALPKNAPPSMVSGAGLMSYTDALSAGKPVESVAAPVAPAAPATSSESAAPVAAGASYLDTLGGGSSTAPTGSGMRGYLDVLPRAPPAIGGAGIKTYTDNLPVTNTVAGTGSGMNTYTDNLSGGKAVTGKSFTPFAASPKTPSFVGSVGGSQIGFTLEASDLSSLVEQLRGSGGTIRLTGSIENISFV